MVLTDTGLAKVFQRIKSFIASQLNSKASAIHTHTSSDITDLPSGYVDLTNNQTVGGNKEFAGTTTAHDIVPSATDTYNFGSSTAQWNNAYIKSLTINGVACGDILTHNVSEFVNVTGAQTIGGVKTFSSNVIIQGSKKVTCNLDNSFIELDGGTTWGKGGSIVLSGQDRSSYTNSVLIVSKSDTNTDILQYQNGELKPLSNNTNNSSLGTSTNKWSKVYSDDVVHTTGDETIGGNKSFKGIIVRNVGNFTAGVAPAVQTTCYVLRHTNNDGTHTANSINSYMFTTGETMCELTQIPCIGSMARTWFRTNTDGTYSIYPYTKNGSLGVPGYQWKDVQTEKINNLNPGALSLPSISSTGANAWIVLDTTDWVKNTAVSFAQKYTPLADGWLNVRVDNATILAIAVGGNYMHQIIRSETANSLALLMPVFKNTEVAIMVGGNENLAYNRVTFYYCQGNV